MARRKAAPEAQETVATNEITTALTDDGVWDRLRKHTPSDARDAMHRIVSKIVQRYIEGANADGFLTGWDRGFAEGFGEGLASCDRPHED